MRARTKSLRSKSAGKAKREDTTPRTETTAGSRKRARIVFDEDGLDPDRETQPAPETNPKTEVPHATGKGEDDADDADDVPEAVSTAQMKSTMERVARDARVEAKEQAAAGKKKRRQRDAHLKKQAEARQAAAAPSTEQEAASEEREEMEADLTALGITIDKDENKDGIHDAPREALSAGRHRQIASRVPLPSILPAEFLTDSDTDSDSAGTDEGNAKEGGRAAPGSSKRRKLADLERQIARERKGPADKMVGSTAYRVMKDLGDGRLAPAKGRSSARIKEMLRQRNRTRVSSVGRKFLVKK